MYTPKSIRKNAKSPMSAPAKLKQKRHVLNFAEKEKVIQKLKLGFTEDKLASDLGASTSTIYKIKKKEDELKKYREENPYSPIRKVFKFSSFPKVDQALKIWFYQNQLDFLFMEFCFFQTFLFVRILTYRVKNLLLIKKLSL